MQVAQQIIGVNRRLGNNAVPNMQGTTRVVFDTATATTATDQTYTFFTGVSSRSYPSANITNNRFEVGESLAIQGFQLFTYSTTALAVDSVLSAPAQPSSALLNIFIGNQRVVKDLEFINIGVHGLGQSMATTQAGAGIYLETPIVIPPQIEFYATVRLGLASALATTDRIVFTMFGTGTLLNTKESF
jgi:hypothetical protein